MRVLPLLVVALALCVVTATVSVSAQVEGSIRLVPLLGDYAPAVNFSSATQVFTSSRGRLEVYHNGEWGTVCDDGFGTASMSVTCKQLGWNTRAGPSGFSYFPVNLDPTSGQLVSGQIWLDDVVCAGTERNITSCPHTAFGTHNCVHSEDQAIDCFNTGPNNPSLPPVTSRSISLSSSAGIVAQNAGATVTLTIMTDVTTSTTLRVAVTCVIGSTSTVSYVTISSASTSGSMSISAPSSYSDSSMVCTARYSSGDSRFFSVPAVSVTINVNVIVGVSAVTQAALITPWTARSYASAANYGTTGFVVAGGMAADGVTPLNDVWLYSGSTWYSLGAAPWSPRSRSTLVSMTGLSGTNPFMVFAGRSASGTATGDMWTTASISGNSWSRSSTSAVSAREGAVAVAWRGSVFFIGGSSSNTLSASYPTTLVAFSSTSASSTQWAAAPWVGRKYHGAVVMNDQLYVFGGLSSVGIALNDVWRLSNPSDDWVQLSSMSCSPRHSFSFGVASTGLAVVGGVDGTLSTLSSACFFDGDHTWSAVKYMPFSSSAASGAMPTINGQLYLLGGSTSSSVSASNDVWTLQMDPGFFAASRVANAPPPESSSSSRSPLVAILVPIGVFLLIVFLVVMYSQRRKREIRRRAQNQSAAAVQQQQREAGGSQMVQMHSPPGGATPYVQAPNSPYAGQQPTVQPNAPMSPVMIYTGNANSAYGGAAAPQLYAPPAQYASPAPVAPLAVMTPAEQMQPGSPSAVSYAAPVPYAAAPVSPVLPAHVASDSKNRVHAELFTILDSLSACPLSPAQQSRVQSLVAHVHLVINELLSMPRAIGLEFAPMVGGFGANPATPGPAAVQRIDADSPAAQLGGLIQLNDQIIAIEGVPVQSAAHASFLLSKSLIVLPGQTADLSLSRLQGGYPTAVRALLTVQGASNVPPHEVTNRMAALAADIAAARQLQAECGVQAR